MRDKEKLLKEKGIESSTVYPRKKKKKRLDEGQTGTYQIVGGKASSNACGLSRSSRIGDISETTERQIEFSKVVLPVAGSCVVWLLTRIFGVGNTESIAGRI